MKTDLYQQAYACLGRITPIPADCGKLCGAKCCGGNDGDGMILFPGEAEFLSSRSFLTIRKSEMSGKRVDFATCKGTCPRNLRPISCRIFPLAPIWDGKELRVIPDPRAQYICPLLSAPEAIEPVFFNAVHTAFSILLKDAEISDMLLSYSEMLNEYLKYTKTPAD